MATRIFFLDGGEGAGLELVAALSKRDSLPPASWGHLDDSLVFLFVFGEEADADVAEVIEDVLGVFHEVGGGRF